MALELKNVSTIYTFTPKSKTNDLEIAVVVGTQNDKEEVCYGLFNSITRYPLTKEIKGEVTHFNSKYNWNLSESVKCKDGHSMPAKFLANNIERMLTSGYHNLQSCGVKDCKTPESLKESMGALSATAKALYSADGKLIRWVDFVFMSNLYKENSPTKQEEN